MFSSYEETSVSKQVGEHELKFTIKYDDSNLEIEYLPDISHYALPAEVPSLLMLSFIAAVHEVAQNFCQQRGKRIIHHDASFPVFQALTWSLYVFSGVFPPDFF